MLAQAVSVWIPVRASLGVVVPAQEFLLNSEKGPPSL
jgi:hypothetical protein